LQRKSLKQKSLHSEEFICDVMGQAGSNSVRDVIKEARGWNRGSCAGLCSVEQTMTVQLVFVSKYLGQCGYEISSLSIYRVI